VEVDARHGYFLINKTLIHRLMQRLEMFHFEEEKKANSTGDKDGSRA
jgi:hypothetical protein